MKKAARLSKDSGTYPANEFPLNRPFPVDHLLQELLFAEDQAKWEKWRLHKAVNRVYRIPLTADGDTFVVAKLLPGRWQTLRAEWKIHLRNLIYGEHDIADLGKQVQMEIQRYAEWRREGFNVPRLIETRFENVRVTEGINHPTLREIIDSEERPIVAKLDAVGIVAAALSEQHGLGSARGLASLIHRDPSSKNILVDTGSRTVYWIDLEHPSEYKGMTLERLMIRALRSFVYSTVYRRPEVEYGAYIRQIASAYQQKQVLCGLAASIQQRPFPFRVMTSLGLRKHLYERQLRIAEHLSGLLREQDVCA